MLIPNIENTVINWDQVPSERVNGITGFVDSKSVMFTSFSIRRLHFSKNYEADHWCEKGHLIFVISGELIIEQKNDKLMKVQEGNSLVLGDDVSLHKAKTEMPSVIIIID